MNTTPTRMVYDRLTRQQQLSIAVALATTHIATDREIAGEEVSSYHISVTIAKSIKGLMRCVVALFTRSAVCRGVLHSPEERRVVIHH